MIAAGPPRRVLELAAEGAFELIVPEAVLVELRRILELKLGLDPIAIDAIADLIREGASEVVADAGAVEAISGDPADDRILAAATSAGAEALISGDRRHLLPLGAHRGMRIVTPQAFIAEWLY